MGKTAATKYVAIDCHDSTLVLEVMSGSGTVEMSGTVATKRETILNLIKSLQGPVEIVFEEGILAQWLYEVLQPTGHRIVVCDPRKNRRQGSKSDRIDVHLMANRLRLGEISPVYHQIGEIQALKEMTGSYLALVQDSVRTMLRTKSIYRARAIGCKGKKVYTVEDRKEWLKRLPPPAAFRAGLLGEELDLIRTLRQRAKAAMVKEAQRQPAFEILNSLPFVGPVRAALLMAHLITPWRFRTKRQIWGYAGLAVVSHSTADHQFVDGKLVRRQRPPMTRGLNPNHNRTVKDVFRSIAKDGARREGVWKTFYEALLTQGMRPEMAELTLTRKIAATTLAIWKKGVRFDPKLTSRTT